MAEPGLRNGVYSYREAARILAVPQRTVQRWADGYTFPRKYDVGVSRPILQTERNPGVLNFFELVELLFVREYSALGISLPAIRRTAENLAGAVGPYPFSTEQLIVSGRDLLLESAEGILQRSDVGQLVSNFAREFGKSVEIRNERVGRLYIDGFDRAICLDREIRAGEPIVSEHAVPTRIIYDLWEQEKNILSVAEYFDLTETDVSLAIRYEGLWRMTA